MIRAALIAAFAVGAFIFPSVTSAGIPEERQVRDVFDAAIDAELASDFPRLVSLVHPEAQHLFRNILSAQFDVLLRTYTLNEIAAVSGLSRHPQDLGLSDSAFFVLACSSEKARHPDFANPSKYLPFAARGATLDNEGTVRLVLSWSGLVQTERTSFNFVQPFTVAFRREQSMWFLWSCPLADCIGHQWSSDLANQNKTERYTK